MRINLITVQAGFELKVQLTAATGATLRKILDFSRKRGAYYASSETRYE